MTKTKASRSGKAKAAIAAALVNSDGFLLPQNSVAISSFGWALPMSLVGDLAGLDAGREGSRRRPDPALGPPGRRRQGLAPR